MGVVQNDHFGQFVQPVKYQSRVLYHKWFMVGDELKEH